MKNDKDKPYTVEVIDGDTVSILSNGLTNYKVNVNNIKTIKDIKLIMKHMVLHFTPNSKEEFEEMKHLLFID